MEIAIFQFDLISVDELLLPRYKGSVFRGVLGHALKKTVCITGMSSCDNCLVREQCTYAFIFESANKRNEKISRPFVIEPPLTEKRIFPPGATLVMNLVLIGSAIKHLPYLIYAFREMGNRGIGMPRGKFWVDKVYSVKDKQKFLIYSHQTQLIEPDYPTINLFSLHPEETEKIRINFLTPVALKTNGNLASKFDFPLIFKALIRRIKALSFFYNGEIGNQLDFDLSEINKIVLMESELYPYNWQRISNRQKTKIRFDGYLGSMVYSGNLMPYMPLLHMGEYVHIGRGTVYGMGKYQLEVLS